MRYLAALPLLFTAACHPGDRPRDNAVDINAAAVQAQGSVNAYANSVEIPETETPSNESAMAPLAPPEPGEPGGLPKGGVVSEAPFTPDSAQGGADVVQRYYALLGEGKYHEAWGLRDDGASGMTEDAFVKSFAKYSEYHANTGAPGDVDAGAGQRYVTVPVQVYARLKAGGRPEYLIGAATLHRVGDIDGATAAQKTWHIRSIDLKPAPVKR